MKKVLSAMGLVVLSVVPSMAAVTVDYSGAVTSLEGQLTTALTAALPIFGTILAIYVGVKLFKRFTKGA